MSKKNLKRSLALSALMTFVITGSAMAGEVLNYTTFVDGASNKVINVTEDTVVNAGDSAKSLHEYTLNVGDGVNLTLNEISRGGYSGGVKNITGNGNVTIINNLPGVALDSGGTINVKNLSVTSNDNNPATRYDSAKKGGSITIVATEDVYFHTGDHAIHTEGGNVKIDARNVTIENELDDVGRSIINSYGGSVEITASGDFTANRSIMNYPGTYDNGSIEITANNISVGQILNYADGAVILNATNNLSAKNAGTVLYLGESSTTTEGTGDIVLSAGGKMEIEGDVVNDGISKIVASFNGNDSYLKGAAQNNGDGEINFAFNNGAKWEVTDDSSVSHVTGNDFVITGAQGVARSAEANSLTIVNDKNTGDVDSNGIYSTGNATISNLKNLDVTSANRHAIEVATGMEIEAEGVKLTSNNGNGILAYGDLTIKANDMGIIAQNGHGIRAAEDDGHAANVNIDVERLTVVAENPDETSIKVSNGAKVSANASDTANINGQILAEVDSAVKLSGGNVNVTSVEDALDTFGGTIEVDATNINIKSTEKDGIQADDAIVTLKGENVTVVGETYGIKNISENASSVVVNATNATIGSADGNNAIWVMNAGGAGEVVVNGTGTVNVNGEVLVELGQAATLKGETVNVTSNDKDAIDSWGGKVVVDATDSINIESKNNDAIQANDANITLTAKNEVNIKSAEWAIKNLDETNSKVVINATDVVIEGGEGSGAIMTSENGKGEVTVNGTGTTTIKGDIDAQSKGSVNVLLNNADSSLTGAVKTGDGATTTLTMNGGATWNVTGDSKLSVLAGNGANINVGDGVTEINIGESKNDNVNVNKDFAGDAVTREDLQDLKKVLTGDVKDMNIAATATDAALTGDVTMDASGKVVATMDSDDLVVGGVSVKETAANLDAEVANRQAEVGRLDNRIDKVDAKIDKVGAMAAAMASLKTMGYDPEAPTEIAVGVGQYRNETGLAIGAFHYPNKNFMLNFSLSTAGDEVMGGIGATWKIGRKR